MSHRYMNTLDLLKYSNNWEQSMRMMLSASPKTVLTTADLDRIRGIVTDVTGMNVRMISAVFYGWCAKTLAPMGKSVAGISSPNVSVKASSNSVIPDDLVSSLEAAGYLSVFYDDNYNEVPVEKATKISVFSVKDWANDKVTLKIPKRNILTFEYVMSKLSAGSVYKNFADTFKTILDSKRQGNGLIVYPTTYGIGIFVAVGRRDSIEEIKAEVASTLEQYGIQYSTEYSDAGWVFRYRISRSADNLAKIQQINHAVTASLKIGDATSHGIIEDETDTQWLINDKWILKSMVTEGDRPDIARLKSNVLPSSVPSYLVDKTLEDVIKFGIPVDSNGNITLYHGTSPKNATLIAKNGLDPWSYLSTSPAVSRRFGSKVITVIANPSLFVSHGNSIQVSDPALTLQNMDRLYPRGNVFGLSASDNGSPSGRQIGINSNEINEIEKEPDFEKVTASSQLVSVLLKCPNKTALAFIEDLFDSISLYNTGMSRDIRVVYNTSSDDPDPKSQVMFFDGDGPHRCRIKKSGDKDVVLDTNLITYSECLEKLIALLLSSTSLAIDCEDSKMVEYYENKPPVSESVVSQKSVKSSDVVDRDTEYLNCVKSGNLEKAMFLIEQAAFENGYTLKLYHGTSAGEFDVFKPNSYFTPSYEFAEKYATTVQPDGTLNPKIYSVFVRPGNIKEVSFDTVQDEVNDLLDKKKKDTLLIKEPLFDEAFPEYIVKNPEQIKLADVVTFDDSGEVIPLSSRFDSGSKDIRAAKKVEATGVYGFTLQDPVTVAKWAKAIKPLHFEEGMVWLFKNTQGEELTLEVCDLLRKFYVEVTGENIRDVRGTWIQNTCPRLVKEAGKKFLGSLDIRAAKEITSSADRRYTLLGVTDESTTCDVCGKVDLKSTLVLQDNVEGGIIYCGSTCGRKLLGDLVKDFIKEGKDINTRVRQAISSAWVNHPTVAKLREIDRKAIDTVNREVNSGMSFSERLAAHDLYRYSDPFWVENNFKDHPERKEEILASIREDIMKEYHYSFEVTPEEFKRWGLSEYLTLSSLPVRYSVDGSAKKILASSVIGYHGGNRVLQQSDIKEGIMYFAPYFDFAADYSTQRHNQVEPQVTKARIELGRVANSDEVLSVLSDLNIDDSSDSLAALIEIPDVVDSLKAKGFNSAVLYDFGFTSDFDEQQVYVVFDASRQVTVLNDISVTSSEDSDMVFRLNAEKAAKNLLDELAVLHSNMFKNTLIGIEYGKFFFSISSDRFDVNQAPYVVKFFQSDTNVASFSSNSALPTINVYVDSDASTADAFTDDVYDLRSFIYSNFIHEHTHLQDIRRNKKPQSGVSPENAVEYYNSPMEFDAYYQQALSSINRTLVNRLDQSDILESFESFKQFALPFFHRGFLKNLTPETEKRLWKRLYRYFTDHDFAKYVDSFYGKASAKVPDELTDLAAVAMTSNSFQEFLSKVRQAHAGDISNRELHRYSRGFGVYSEDEYVTVANIPVEFPEYLAMIYKSDKSLYNLITSDSDLITIYRAVPEDVVSIQFGDYVALKKSYAEMHLNSVITGQQGKPGKILKMSVPKSDVRWNGEDWSEWVYAPSDLTKQFHSLESFYKSVKDRPMPVTAKSDTGWSVPESLKAFSRNINSIENTSGWEAKTLLANSGGKVGDWTSVMYVLFNPATGELIPVSRHDEHQRGYELLYHLYKKYKLPRGKYVALCVNSYNYLMYESDKDLFLDAVKAWDALGGKQLVIEDVSKGSSYRFYSTDLENGIPAPAEKGSLSRDGSYIVDSLKQLTSLLKKLYTFPDDATVDRFNTLSVQFMNYLLEKFPIELGDVSTAISTAIPKIKSAPAGNFNEAAQAVFAHNGVKNLIHMKLRKAVDDKDSFEMRFLQLVFGDVALAKKMFDALNSDVITAKKKNKWEPYSDTETAKLSEKFGISFGKDKNGYFCYTHRARSESYDSVDKIPLKSLSFISSTGSDKGFKRHPVHPDDIMGCLPDYAPVATGKVSPETIIRKNMPSNGIVIGRKIIPVACLAPTENASIKDPEKVKAIATSMSAGKEIDPLLVEFNPYVTEGQTYQFPIVDGHHRYLGAIAAGKIDLPCVVIAQIQDFDCLRMENMSAVASADSDTAYMEAAESGDIETCSRMVKEAAERAGYNVGPVYHGTNSAKGFMVFDKAYQSSNENLRLGNGFYFTGLLSVATSYSNREGAAGSVLKFFLKISNPLKLNSISQFNAIVNKDLHKPITPNNPVLDYSEKIQKLGYDGILFYFNDSLWELVVYSPEQIKSADPITYDDSGAIIPLSNRFNSNSMDVRASKEDQLKKGEKVESEHDDTYKWIKDYYKKNGKFPTEEEVRKAIAEDHLSEIDNYYDLLQKMEKEAGV